VEKILLPFEDIRTKAKCDDWTGKLRLRKLRRALKRKITDGGLSEVRSHKHHQTCSTCKFYCGNDYLPCAVNPLACKSPFSKCNDWDSISIQLELRGYGDRFGDLQKHSTTEEASIAAVEAIFAYLR
jgi:hypothetical protein